MTTQTIKTFVQNIGRFLAKNSPTILTGCAVAGTITTAVLAAKAHEKARERISDELENQLSEPNFYAEDKVIDVYGFNFKERLKLTWKCYIPPVIMGATTIGCIIGAHSINLHRNAVLAGAYTLAETSLKEFKDKAKEIVGEEKVKEIKDKIIDDKIKDNPPSKNEIMMIGCDETLCYDVYSGRYFKSAVNDIKTAVNAANTELMSNMRITLNDMYYAMGLKAVKLGAERGWDFNDAIDYRKDFPIEPRFSSHLAEDNTPCLAIEFHPEPDYL